MAESIQSFQVDIGYALDEGSVKRAEQSLQLTDAAVQQVQTSVAAMIKVLQQLSGQLSATAGKPVSDLQHTSHQLSDIWDKLRKGAVEWGKVTTLAVGGFVKSMQEVATQYNNLYYLSQRTGASIQSLTALSQASRRLGGDAGEAAAAVSHMQDMFQTAPGTREQFLSYASGYAEQVRKDMGLTTEQWNHLDQATKDYAEGVAALENMPAYLQKEFGEKWFGWNYDQIQKHIAARKQETASIGESLKELESFGLSQKRMQEISKQGTQLTDDWGKAWGHLQLIWTQAFGQIEPVLHRVLTTLDSLVQVVLKANTALEKLGIPAASIEAFAAVAGSTALILKAIKGITGIDILGGIFGKSKKGADDLHGKLGDIEKSLKRVCDEKCNELGKGLEEAAKKGGFLKSVLETAGKLQTSPLGPVAGGVAAAVQVAQLTQEAIDKLNKAPVEGYGEVATGGTRTGAFRRGHFMDRMLHHIGMGLSDIDKQQAEYKAEHGETEAERAEARKWLEQHQERQQKAAQPGPSAQAGGIVKIAAHEGEMILPKPISEGLQRLFKEGGGGGEMSSNRIMQLATSVAQKVAPAIMGPMFTQANILMRLIPMLQQQMARYDRLGPSTIAREAEQSPLGKAFEPAHGFLQRGHEVLAQNADRRLGDWLTGIGSAPKTVIANVEEFAEQFVQALARKRGGGATGEAADGAGAPGAGVGAPGEAGAPTTAGGRWGRAAGEAVGAAEQAVTSFAGAKGGSWEQKGPAVMAALQRDLGLTKEQAAGIWGNVGQEVGTNFEEMQEKGVRSGRGGYGWAQWTGERRTAFERFAQENKLDPASDEANYRFMVKEMRDDPRFLQKLRGTKSVAEATSVVQTDYEKPGTPMAARRQAYAQQAFAMPEPEQLAAGGGPVTPGFPRGGQLMPGEIPKDGGRVQQSQLKSGATRDMPISAQLNQQLESAAADANVMVRVKSGGQMAEGPKRTGSHRHDFGGSADLELIDPKTGRVLDMRRPEDQATMAKFMKSSVTAGATGVGAGLDYMGPSTMHIGGGSSAAWGAGGSSRTAPQWVREAHAEGTSEREAARRGGSRQVVQAQHATPKPEGMSSAQKESYIADLQRMFPPGSAQEAPTPTLVAGGAMSKSLMQAQRGGIIPDIMGGIMPLLAHAGEMVLPQELSHGLQRMVRNGDALAGLERMGAMRLGGDRMTGQGARTNNVTFNQTNTNSFSGGAQGSPESMSRQYRDAHERIYGDLVRNFRAVLA